MSKDDILVIHSKAILSQEKLEDIRQKILKQKDEGVIVLPHFCEPVIVPKDIEIQLYQNDNIE